MPDRFPQVLASIAASQGYQSGCFPADGAAQAGMKVAPSTLRRDLSGGRREGIMKIDSAKGKEMSGGAQGGTHRTES